MIFAPWLVQLLVGLAINIVGYLLQPKAKTSKPEAVENMEAPTADAGRPIPVVFGDVTIMSPNVLWYGESRSMTGTVKV